MADKTIGELPRLSTMEDDTLIPVEHDGSAKAMPGTVLGDYVYSLVEGDVKVIAGIIAVGPKGDKGDKGDPGPVGPKGDTGSRGLWSSSQQPNPAGASSPYWIFMLEDLSGTPSVGDVVLYGEYYYSVTSVQFNLVYTIDPVSIRGADGVSPVITGAKSGKVTTLTIVDRDHPEGATLATIKDGADGTGAGDMTKDTYDTDDSGVVDDSERLGGQLPSYYMVARPIDTAPVSGSSNLITSGAVYDVVGDIESALEALL